MGGYSGSVRRLVLGAMFLLVVGGAATAQTAHAADASIVQIIYEEAARYGVSGDWLYWTAYCETGGTFRTDLVGAAGERGVFQWHPFGLWWDTPAGRAGHPVPAGNPRLGIAMAAWAFAHGYASHWTCS